MLNSVEVNASLARPVIVQAMVNMNGVVQNAAIVSLKTGKVVHVGNWKYIRRVAREKYNLRLEV